MASDESTDSDVSSTYHSEGEIPCCLMESESSCDTDSSNSVDEVIKNFPAPTFTTKEQQHIAAVSNQLSEGIHHIFPQNLGWHLEKHFSSIHRRLRTICGDHGSLIFVNSFMEQLLLTKPSKSMSNTVLFDVYLFRPWKPVMVLTFADVEKRSITDYNIKIGRSFQIHVINDLNLDLTCIQGVIDRNALQSDELFVKRISELENDAYQFSVPISLHMNPCKCSNTVQSFLKLIPTTSEPSDTGITFSSKVQLHVDGAVALSCDTDTVEITDPTVKLPTETATLSRPLRLVLIGRSGSGKSATGNTIIGKTSFVSCLSVSPVTKSCQEVSIQRFNRSITVTDTPDLWEIRALVTVLKGVDAVLYVCRLGKYTSEENIILHHLADYLGSTFSNILTLIFTGKDDIDNDNITIEKYLQTCPQGMQALVRMCQNRYFTLDNTLPYDKNSTNASELLSIIEQTGVNHQTSGHISIHWESAPDLLQYYITVCEETTRTEYKSDDKGQVMKTMQKRKQEAKRDVTEPNESGILTPKETHQKIQMDMPKPGGGNADLITMKGTEVLHLPDRLRMVLIGKAGSGKSSTGNTITGEQCFVSRVSESPVTQLLQEVTVPMFGSTITVVDTPDVWTIMDSLAEILAGAHAVIFVSRLGRCSDEETAILKCLKHSCGKIIYQYLILVFSCGDDLEGTNPACFIKNCKHLQTLMVKCQNRYTITKNRASAKVQSGCARNLLSMAGKVIKNNRGSCCKPDLKYCLQSRRSISVDCLASNRNRDKRFLDLQEWRRAQRKLTEIQIREGGILEIITSDMRRVLEFEMTRGNEYENELEKLEAKLRQMTKERNRDREKIETMSQREKIHLEHTRRKYVREHFIKEIKGHTGTLPQALSYHQPLSNLSHLHISSASLLGPSRLSFEVERPFPLDLHMKQNSLGFWKPGARKSKLQKWNTAVKVPQSPQNELTGRFCSVETFISDT